MSVGPQIDLSKVPLTDLFPEGRHRARIAAAENRPKNTEFGPNGEVPGVFNDSGDPRYGYTNVGFVFMEHPSNVDVDPQTGKPVNLAGRWHWEKFSWHPKQLRRLHELFLAAEAEISRERIEPAPLVSKEVDVVLKNKPRSDDQDVLETRVQATRKAVDAG